MSELRVTEAHLRELAAKQADAAARMQSATAVAVGLGAAVGATHGPIAAATAAAVQAAEAARTAAGTATAHESHAMAGRLEASATAYSTVDQGAATAVRTQV